MRLAIRLISYFRCAWPTELVYATDSRSHHMLTAVGEKGLKCEELADTVDNYLANPTYKGRSKSTCHAHSNKRLHHVSDANSPRKSNASNWRVSNTSGKSDDVIKANSTDRAQDGKSTAKFGNAANETKNGRKKKGLRYFCQGQANGAGQTSANVRTPMARLLHAR